MFNALVGIWITAGILIGFAVPPIHDGNLILRTRQIAFFHVPMAIAMEVGFLMAAWYGVSWLRTRQPRYDALSLAYAEAGSVCCVIATVTGAIFAKTNWGAYWSWDPQEVGILTTLLTYAALFALRGAVEDEDKRRSLWAVYAIIGLLVAVFSTMVYRRLLPDNASLHPANPLIKSDVYNKFALWFNVIGYVMLLVWDGQAARAPGSRRATLEGVAMGLGKDLLFVLAVALVTWGGVFFYLLRLEQLARSLERQVEELEPTPVEKTA